MTQCGRGGWGGGGQTEEGGEGASALDDDVCTVSERLAGSWRGRWKEEVGASLAKSMKPGEACLPGGRQYRHQVKGQVRRTRTREMPAVATSISLSLTHGELVQM